MKRKKFFICNRKECRFWNKEFENRCVCLDSVYEHDADCKFFKEQDPNKVIDG